MQKTKLIMVSIFGQFICLSPSYSNTQIEGNGFTDGASASILLRNGWIYRDRTDGRHNYNSWGQSAIGKFNTGFTRGPIEFAAELLGDVGFKIGDNKHAGNQMIPHNATGQPYSNWMRGGANVKVKVSETTLNYGTQFLNIPALGSGDARLSPEYFTGTLLNSKEIKDLDINIGYFTKNQQPDQIASDQSHLKRAIIYGAKYRINDHIDTSFYNADLKNALKRQYLDFNYKQVLNSDDYLAFSFNGYHTRYDAAIYDRLSFPSGTPNSAKENYIMGFSSTYQKDTNRFVVSYQQNAGNNGYD